MRKLILVMCLGVLLNAGESDKKIEYMYDSVEVSKEILKTLRRIENNSKSTNDYFQALIQINHKILEENRALKEKIISQGNIKFEKIGQKE